MKKQIKNILFVVLTIFASNDQIFISCREVSSRVKLDSQEDEGDSNDSMLKADLSEIRDEGSVSRILESSVLNSDDGFVRSSDMKKRSHFVEEDLTKQPTVINNIQINVNENGTQPAGDMCKNGICNVSVSSKRDEEGNIVTDVHLNIITKLENRFKTNDIPIFDGIRGLEDTNDPSFNSDRLNYSGPLIYLHNIPQIQSRYQGGEPWYQGRSTFQRPQIRPIIDDKIEPPFSKT